MSKTKIEEGEMICCPFCGAAWRKPVAPPHKEWLRTAINTAVTTGVATVVVLILKLFGL